MTLTFPDLKRRSPEKIKQITKEMQQRFQAIDKRLTLEHRDDFIDYGPEVFPHLAPLYWDVRVPNHPMEHFVYYEYVLRFNGHFHYYITPYNEEMDDYFLTEKDSYWERLEEINDSLLAVIHDYQIQNLAYWKDFYSEKEFQEEIEAIKKRTVPMVLKPSVRALSFVDPKQRDPESVKKMTEWMAKELQELDLQLTLTHDDTFIDFGPVEGKFLAECPYDPEEDDPDDARKDLPDTEYEIFYENYLLVGFTPYDSGYGVRKDPISGVTINFDYLGIREILETDIYIIISTFKLYNLYYWRKLYSPADFQYEVKKLKKYWDLD